MFFDIVPNPSFKMTTGLINVASLEREASLQRFLCKLTQKNFFNENEYDKLYPFGPSRIYSTPKMHKFSSSDTFPKLCRIVSSIGIFDYDLAFFLCDLLSPVVPDDCSSKNTFSFVSQMKNANLSKTFLVSYDVASLFTNIAFQETIDIARDLILNLNLSKIALKSLSFLLHYQLIFFLTVNLIMKVMK